MQLLAPLRVLLPVYTGLRLMSPVIRGGGKSSHFIFERSIRQNLLG